MNKQRMFAWNAPNTYYRELSGGGLTGPTPDQDSADMFRTDAPPKVSGAYPSAAGYAVSMSMSASRQPTSCLSQPAASLFAN